MKREKPRPFLIFQEKRKAGGQASAGAGMIVKTIIQGGNVLLGQGEGGG